MSWSLSLTEIADKQVECTIVPDSSEPGYLEYKFISEQPDTNCNPYNSKLKIKKIPNHDNGGSISVMSVFETCPETGGCEDPDYCLYEVIDVTHRGNPAKKTEKETMNKVMGQI